MRTCLYCGRENDDTGVERRECGTPLDQEVEVSRDRSALCRRLRIALRVIGIGGGVLWFFNGCLLLLFHGFKAGGAQGGMSQGQWSLCIGAVMLAFIYYAVVSGSDWTRGLLLIGFAVHAVWIVAVICIIGLSDGGFIFAPLFFAGAGCWLA